MRKAQGAVSWTKVKSGFAKDAAVAGQGEGAKGKDVEMQETGNQGKSVGVRIVERLERIEKERLEERLRVLVEQKATEQGCRSGAGRTGGQDREAEDKVALMLERATGGRGERVEALSGAGQSGEHCKAIRQRMKAGPRHAAGAKEVAAKVELGRGAKRAVEALRLAKAAA